MRRLAGSIVVASIAACGDSTITSAGDSGGTTLDPSNGGSAPTSSAGPSDPASTTAASGSAGESAGNSSTTAEPATTTASTLTGDTTTAAMPATSTGETTTTGATTTTTGSDACGLDPLPAGAIAVAPACGGNVAKQVVDPWNLEIEWQKQFGGGMYPGVWQKPSVGMLTDDDGDGDVDSDDDVVIVATGSLIEGSLRVLRGADGSTVFEVPWMLGGAGTALGDVDSDGAPDIVAVTMDREVVAIDNTGAIKWKSIPFEAAWLHTQVTVSDLEGDGDVEVIANFAILDGATGALIAPLAGDNWRSPVPADLDLDGTKEIVVFRTVYSSTGVALWSVPNTGDSTFGAVINMHPDPQAEVLITVGDDLYFRQHDGAPIAVYPNPTGHVTGPPCVADFDGDGQIEIGVPSGTVLAVMETDGSFLWQAAVKDDSGSAGCSGYDVEGDGAYELFFADEQTFRIHDGTTGQTLYYNTNHNSGTVWEYPVIADVDKDGSAEIVLAAGYGVPYGITVIGHVDDGWSAAGQDWAIHDYAVTNTNPDGSVPATHDPPWLTHKLFRARPTVDPPRPDLLVNITTTCVDCATAAKVAYQVCNQGGSDVPAGVPLTLFALADMLAVPVETRLLPAVPAGECLAGDVFAFDPALLVDGGVLLRLYDDGVVNAPNNDCGRANDAAAADLVGC